MADIFEVSYSVTENGKKRREFTLETDINGEVSLKDFLDFTKSSLIVIADAALKDEQANGFDKEPIMLVDGRRSKNPQQVHPLGSFEFIARQSLGEIVLETYEALLYRSKVKTGTYKSSHYVFLNGTQVATDEESLKTWLDTNPTFKETDRVRIVNIQPYARRLELLGVTAQRSNKRTEDRGRRKKKVTGIEVKVPNGTYSLTVRAMKSKYKNNVKIRFTFLQGSQLGLSGVFKGGRKGKNSAGRPYLYPSIVFDVGARGIL